eukprot:m.158783 g.158783  ORF g.158783 m.158783 type:complete len:338 (-) comp53005_c0_seq1:33-1046(-)
MPSPRVPPLKRNLPQSAASSCPLMVRAQQREFGASFFLNLVTADIKLNESSPAIPHPKRRKATKRAIDSPAAASVAQPANSTHPEIASLEGRESIRSQDSAQSLVPSGTEDLLRAPAQEYAPPPELQLPGEVAAAGLVSTSVPRLAEVSPPPHLVVQSSSNLFGDAFASECFQFVRKNRSLLPKLKTPVVSELLLAGAGPPASSQADSQERTESKKFRLKVKQAPLLGEPANQPSRAPTPPPLPETSTQSSFDDSALHTSPLSVPSSPSPLSLTLPSSVADGSPGRSREEGASRSMVDITLSPGSVSSRGSVEQFRRPKKSGVSLAEAMRGLDSLFG